jgi:aspartyl-tRNA(Asn)/glutamyl-tRNA(Gln) amidotransferase subunit A
VAGDAGTLATLRQRTDEDMVDPGDYARLTASEMARHVRDGDLSPVELARAALGAIEHTEGRLNAYSEVFARSALARASALENDARRKAFRGPLHGVPFAVKDLFDVTGTVTRRGSRLYADAMSADTAPIVERMLAAGAVLVGKNTTPELGWKASSQSPLYGVTRNPWDPARTAGGSSSGSAAAVAAGTVPIALGSDGGGSMRIPAAFCGIFSLKANLGRIPTHPPSATEHFSHAGPMTRSVADYALALDVLAGPDDRDPNSLQKTGTGYAASLARRDAPMRCAFAPSLFGKPVAASVRQCVDRAIGRMRSELPVEIVDRQPDWEDPIDAFEALWTARGSLYLDLDESAKGRLDPGFARMVARSSALGVAGHLRALQRRAGFCRTVAEWFAAERFDLLLLPMVPIEPFAAEDDGPPDMDPAPAVPWTRWTPFSYPFNLTGQPAASVPCGWTDTGLPVGLQVVGRRFDDLAVLQFCHGWERRFDWQARLPRVHAGA